MSCSILIIGGGVIGAFCADTLAADGHRVTILDRGLFGNACSHGNCGYICPSHVLPLTQPGVVWKMGPKAFFKSSPLYIKPRLDPRLICWLLQFTRNCTHSQMIRAGHALAALLDSSRAIYESLATSDGVDCDWQSLGMMFVYRSRHELDHFESTAKLIEDEFHRRYEKLDGDELIKREPALKPGVAGAWYFKHDAHIRPDRLMKSLKKRLLDRGVTILESTAVTGFDRTGSTVRSVRTANGTIAADQFVLAAGAWSPQIQGELGIRLPIQPGKGYSITMPRPSICPRFPLILEERRVAITPMSDGYRIGSTMEFSGYDESLNAARLDALVAGASHYLREPTASPVIEKWFGFRPMTPDSLPIIGRCPNVENVFLATGHNMLGLSLATGTGRLVAELVAGRPPHVDPAPYSPNRL